MRWPWRGYARQGAVSEAIAITREAAHSAHKRGQPANEVFCLQTATQFGDHSGAQRLAELADQVQGARAPAAAAHAIALAGGDGAALQQVSRDYDALGDRVAAADAAAQAAVALAANGLRGAALTAHAAARRLASDCCCADTPALRTLIRSLRRLPGASARSYGWPPMACLTDRSPNGSVSRCAPSRATSIAHPDESPSAAETISSQCWKGKYSRHRRGSTGRRLTELLPGQAIQGRVAAYADDSDWGLTWLRRKVE